MPKPAPAQRPRAKSGKGGIAPGVLIDDLAAERNSPPLPPEPVFTIDLVEAEAGKHGRRYVAELEEHTLRNAQAAVEARRIALEQRRHLEETARGRLEAEREISKLRRELRTALAEQQRLAAALSAPVAPPPLAEPRGGAARSELTRTREMVEQQQRLLGERREQLVGALRERDAARLEARRAADACDRAKRSLARASEMLQRNAVEETARISATTPSAQEAVGERERMAAAIGAAPSELEGQIQHLTEEVDRLTARAAELEGALAQQTSRAEYAASQSAVLVDDAETASGDAASARQELAAAVARDTAARVTIAELTERLADVEVTASKTMAEREAASSRAAELEALLSTTMDEREAARSQLVDLEVTAAKTVAEREAASSRAAELEALLSTTMDEREAARTQLADLEGEATAREAAEKRAGTQVAELTERLADFEVTAARTVAERDAAQVRIVRLEEALASVDEAPDNDAIAYVDELQASLTRAEDGAAASAARITELARAAAEAQAMLTAMEEARATDRLHAQAQVERLSDRIAELEQMILAVEPTPDAVSTRALAMEELGQLAIAEPPIARSERGAPPATAEGEGTAVEQRELRRSLLATLSDLADVPVGRKDT